MSVTLKAGLATEIVTGGTAVLVVPAGAAGGFITNPFNSDDQGLGASENLYVGPITQPGSTPGQGNGTTFVVFPGGSWPVIANQDTPTYVNAASSGHKFSAIYW